MTGFYRIGKVMLVWSGSRMKVINSEELPGG